MQVDAEVPCFTLTLAKPVTVGVAHLRFLRRHFASQRRHLPRSKGRVGGVPRSHSGNLMLYS